MKIRIYETKEIDVNTVEILLFRADKQANFHPNSTWINRSLDNEYDNYSHLEKDITKNFKELHINWIGRESVISWLVSNQVLFEIISFKLLEHEQLALADEGIEEEDHSEQSLYN